MAAYKDLVGQKITKVTSNPGEPKTGQMWYNSTDGKIRGLAVVEAWASASPMSLARYNTGSFGIQTDAVVAGNDGTYVTTTEEYNGSSWTAGGALPEAKAQANSGGIQTAAFFASGRASLSLPI